MTCRLLHDICVPSLQVITYLPQQAGSGNHYTLAVTEGRVRIFQMRATCC